MTGHTTLPADLTGRMREEILKERLKPGTKLTEQFISERFGVSRTPVRDALARLESEGLIRLVPNRGAFITGMSANDAADMFQIRKACEAQTARRAVERAGDDDIKRLSENHEYMSHYASRGDLKKMKQINPDFHRTVREAAHSRLLSESLERISESLRISAHTKTYRREHLNDIFAEHKAIFDAVTKGDADGAATAMARHIDNAARRALR